MTKPFYDIKMIEASSRYRRGKKVPIFSKTLKIGRSDNCNIRFTDKYSNVSREHLILNYANNKVEIVPLHGNKNKTYVNNTEITKSEIIKSRVVIRAAFKGPRMHIILGSNNKIGFQNLRSIEGIDVAIICSILIFLVLLIKIIMQLVS